MPADPFVGASDLTAFQAGTPATIVAQAQAAIRAYCGWHIAPSLTETIVVDGKGSHHLWLPTLMITAITAITNEGEPIDLVEGVDWSASGYVENRTGYWSERPRQISVSLTHGYAIVPPDLVEVAVSIAARASSSPAGVTREAAGGVQFGYGTFNGVSGGIALLAHEKEILDRYRVPSRV